MIITIDLDKESAAGLRRAAQLLEEAAQAKEPVQQFDEIPAVVHGTKKHEEPKEEPPKKIDFGALKVY